MNMLFYSLDGDTPAEEPSKSKSKKYINQRWIFNFKEIQAFLKSLFLKHKISHKHLSPLFESIHFQVFYNLYLNINNKRSTPLSVSLLNYSLFISFSFGLFGLLVGLFMSRQSGMLW